MGHAQGRRRSPTWQGLLPRIQCPPHMQRRGGALTPRTYNQRSLLGGNCVREADRRRSRRDPERFWRGHHHRQWARSSSLALRCCCAGHARRAWKAIADEVSKLVVSPATPVARHRSDRDSILRRAGATPHADFVSAPNWHARKRRRSRWPAAVSSTRVGLDRLSRQCREPRERLDAVGTGLPGTRQTRMVPQSH